MFKMFATNVVISKGFDGRPPLRFIDTEKGPIVRFRIGQPTYDSRCKDNRRWINLNAKASGAVCERIRKMKLKAGSFVNIIGRYDQELMDGKNGQDPRKFPLLIVEEIEYCCNNGQMGEPDNAQPDSSSTEQNDDQGQEQTATQTQELPAPPPTPPPTEPMPDNFTGFEPLGGADNPYF